jgi:hypothetical protein
MQRLRPAVEEAGGWAALRWVAMLNHLPHAADYGFGDHRAVRCRRCQRPFVAWRSCVAMWMHMRWVQWGWELHLCDPAPFLGGCWSARGGTAAERDAAWLESMHGIPTSTLTLGF